MDFLITVDKRDVSLLKMSFFIFHLRNMRLLFIQKYSDGDKLTFPVTTLDAINMIK